MEEDIIKIHVRIEGRVQGVGYRAWTAGNAKKLGLSGWVRNRLDGWVEAVFSGPKETVDQMLEDCYEGPIASNVEKVVPVEYADEVEQGFHQKSTA